MIRYFLPIFLFINTPLVASESYSFAGEWIVTEEVYSAFTKPEINRARVVRIDFNNPDKCKKRNGTYIRIRIWFGGTKQSCAVNTLKSHINNMCIGVTEVSLELY